MWPTAAEARGPAVVWIHFLQELSPPLPLSGVRGSGELFRRHQQSYGFKLNFSKVLFQVICLKVCVSCFLMRMLNNRGTKNMPIFNFFYNWIAPCEINRSDQMSDPTPFLRSWGIACPNSLLNKGFLANSGCGLKSSVLPLTSPPTLFPSSITFLR